MGPVDYSIKCRRRKATPANADAVANYLWLYSSLGVLLGPFSGRGNSLCLVLFPRLSYVVRERVVWIWGAEEGLNGK